MHSSSSSFAALLSAILLSSTALASPLLTSRQDDDGASKYVSPSSNWSLTGCVQDGYPNYRVLEGAGYYDSSTQTIDNCLSYCDSQGAHLAGLENGNQCYCAPYLLNNGVVGPNGSNLNNTSNDGCSTDAVGSNGSQNGGGPNHLLVFTSTIRPQPSNPTIDGTTYLGCFRDDGSNRLLPIWAQGTDPDNSVGKCATECRNLDSTYDLFGVEYRQECHCGKSSDVVLADGLKEEQCYLSCTGDEGQLCGGNDHLSVYRLD